MEIHSQHLLVLLLLETMVSSIRVANFHIQLQICGNLLEYGRNIVFVCVFIGNDDSLLSLLINLISYSSSIHVRLNSAIWQVAVIVVVDVTMCT